MVPDFPSANTEGKSGFFTQIHAFLVFNATWDDEFLGKSLKLGCSFGIIGLDLCRIVSEVVSKLAGVY